EFLGGPLQGSLSNDVHTDMSGKKSGVFRRHLRQDVESDLSKSRESRHRNQTGRGDVREVRENDAFERQHTAQNLQAFVGDTGAPSLIRFQPGQVGDVTRSYIRRLWTVHEN